ncbi:MAG: hypothetical protein ACJ0O9_03470 [Flavobacteriaceae bacterium]
MLKTAIFLVQPIDLSKLALSTIEVWFSTTRWRGQGGGAVYVANEDVSLRLKRDFKLLRTRTMMD